IVDACNSGMSYVKDLANGEKQFLEKSVQAAQFKNCYFMFSSRGDQQSFQDDRISDFTGAIIDAVVDRAGHSVRYGDIIASVADAFSANPSQTPHFVTQGAFTDVFGAVPPNIAEILGGQPVPKLTTVSPSATIIPAAPRFTLVERIRKDAKRYASESEVRALIEQIPSILKAHSFGSEFLELFDIEIDSQVYPGTMPEQEVIGGWLDKNSNLGVFARVERRTHTYEDEEFTFGLRVGNLPGKKVTRTVEKISGFEPTVETPNRYSTVVAKAKLENLAWWQAGLTYLVSKTQIHVFHYVANLIAQNWERRHLSQTSWKVRSTPTTDLGAFKRLIDDIVGSLETTAMLAIEKTFPPDGEEGKPEQAAAK
ncbi:MAG: hypothetical protein JWM53_377, partial [bacterium]|nr:hypothetical protein [bacterium]